MKKLGLVLAIVALPSVSFAQSAEQLYRNINAALAQDNARLGQELSQAQEQIKQLLTSQQQRPPEKPKADK